MTPELFVQLAAFAVLTPEEFDAWIKDDSPVIYVEDVQLDEGETAQ